MSNSYEQGSTAEDHEQSASVTRLQGGSHKSTQFDDARRQETRAKRTKMGDTSPFIASYEGSSMSGSDSGLDRLVARSPKPTTVNDQDQDQRAENSTGRGNNDDATFEKQEPSFVIDVDPTPVNFAEIATKSRKRVFSIGDHREANKTKKSKTRHNDDEQPSSPANPEIEFEDISQEVDARLKEKEEKRKRKERKRKKIADVESNVTGRDADTIAEGPARLKKKKKVKNSDDAPLEASEAKKRSSAESDEGQGERRKKRHKKTGENNNS